MPAYLLRRIAMTIPTLLLVSIAVFTLMRLIPGDPVLLMLGEGADPAQLALMRHQMGLDQPLPVQYLVWLRHALAGDLGVSTTNGLPVLPLRSRAGPSGYARRRQARPCLSAASVTRLSSSRPR